MQWEDVPEAIESWSQALDAIAWDLRKHAADAWTLGDVGYYADPATGQVALYSSNATGNDLALCKAAACRALGATMVGPLFFTYQTLADPDCQLVKLAYSPTVRRLGELLNFFPGQYPGDMPNTPSPAASMLTSGVVGAGLGYGLGRIGGALLPGGYGDHLGRTGAILGGALGAAPGAIWALANRSSGHTGFEGWPLNSAAGSQAGPAQDAQWLHGGNAVPATPEPPSPVTDKLVDDYIGQSPLTKASSLLASLPLGQRWQRASEKVADEFGGTFGNPYTRPEATPIDVNINALGQTLWGSGASPQLAGNTMGAMYAAQQMPDPRSRPGFVTGHQLGTLASHAAGDYMTGLLVGRAINAVIGSPYNPTSYGLGAVDLGVLGAVVPRLFGG